MSDAMKCSVYGSFGMTICYSCLTSAFIEFKKKGPILGDNDRPIQYNKLLEPHTNSDLVALCNE